MKFNLCWLSIPVAFFWVLLCVFVGEWLFGFITIAAYGSGYFIGGALKDEECARELEELLSSNPQLKKDKIENIR